MINIIRKKRDKQELTKEEIHFLMQGYISGEIPDYQVSAFLMATYLNGMTAPETCSLTEEMMNSGKVLDLSCIEGFKVDKHSTGGVGDKTSIPLLAIASACGCKIPMVSGRGLEHTGGTIDKFESIKGFQVQLKEEEFKNVVKKVGCSIIGATENIAPADKKIYALRDVTATVASIPLIASSIMSKKLASGTDGLILDVKVGAGAFMKTIDQARELARAMIDIGKGMNKKMMALLTYMDQPLGQAVGNAIEIYESLDILRGKISGDIFDLTIELAAHMVHMSGITDTYEKGKLMALESIKNGSAIKKFKELIIAQQGDASFIGETSDSFNLVPEPQFKIPVLLELPQMQKGKQYYIKKINALEIGLTACYLGAGRVTKDSVIDLAVGIYIYAKIGDQVEVGKKVAEILANDKKKGEEAVKRVLNAIELSEEKVERPKVVLETVY